MKISCAKLHFLLPVGGAMHLVLGSDPRTLEPPGGHGLLWLASYIYMSALAKIFIIFSSSLWRITNPYLSPLCVLNTPPWMPRLFALLLMDRVNALFKVAPSKWRQSWLHQGILCGLRPPWQILADESLGTDWIMSTRIQTTSCLMVNWWNLLA